MYVNVDVNLNVEADVTVDVNGRWTLCQLIAASSRPYSLSHRS